MAKNGKPETADGYAKIANELLEALARVHMPSIHWQVLFLIFRFTYGFHRKTAGFTMAEIAAKIGRPKRSTERAIADLKKWRMLANDNGCYGIIKYYLQWGKKMTVQFCTKNTTTQENVHNLCKTLTKEQKKRDKSTVIFDGRNDIAQQNVSTGTVKNDTPTHNSKQRKKKITPPTPPRGEGFNKIFLKKIRPEMEDEEIEYFIKHWTEEDENGTQKWQKEATFAFPNRLDKWHLARQEIKRRFEEKAKKLPKRTKAETVSAEMAGEEITQGLALWAAKMAARAASIGAKASGRLFEKIGAEFGQEKAKKWWDSSLSYTDFLAKVEKERGRKVERTDTS